MGNIYEKTNSKNKVFCHINRKTKKGYYLIFEQKNRRNSQYNYCEKIHLIGFEKLPSGFYTNDGLGLTASGFLLLQELFAKCSKKLELTVVSSGKAKLYTRSNPAKVQIPHSALSTLNSRIRTIRKIRNDESRAAVRRFLFTQLSTQFSEYRSVTPEYTPGVIADVLRKKGLFTKLNLDDRTKVEEFIPEYLSRVQGTLRAKDKLKVIFESLDAGKKIYLEKIVKEFKQKLARSAQNEALWQDFLSEHILVLRNTYGQVLEKESVTLQGKFPDFLLIDPYNYLDIYEIKKPGTNLLKHDKSRNNYYWDVELTKAISQVENYLHQIQRNSDTLVNDIRKAKGIEIGIVRPRGYIIAGLRKQLTSVKMQDDFRILNESLKNIDVLLYDDLLSSLESFIKRIGS
ncbi:MAG: Shedu immune nuclease family protein [Pseudomonadota bacterium]